MATDKAASSSLLSDRAPETSLSVQLHPLVLLTISDYITRHTLRSQKGPVVGAVIGQQNGRQVTLEHAYECLIITSENEDSDRFDEAFFNERLEQYKDVHKVPQLDLVAIFMLGPSSGPTPSHLPLLKQAQSLTGSDGVLLLLFHPESATSMEGGKLPISLYEGHETQIDEKMETRFWDRNFEVETGEAEMIGVDFVAKGGGNASAVTAQTTPESSKETKGKGKGKAKDKDKDVTDDSGVGSREILSKEDDELVSSLTAKLNAIKMLKQRLAIIHKYLASLPDDSLTNPNWNTQPSSETNHALLRSIRAMLSRLPLLAPQTVSKTTEESSIEGVESLQKLRAKVSSQEQEDVQLTSLLASLTRSVAEAQVLSAKFSEVQRERSSRDRTALAGGRGNPLLADMMDTNDS